MITKQKTFPDRLPARHWYATPKSQSTFTIGDKNYIRKRNGAVN